jgi:hypothetical protein
MKVTHNIFNDRISKIFEVWAGFLWKCHEIGDASSLRHAVYRVCIKKSFSASDHGLIVIPVTFFNF